MSAPKWSRLPEFWSGVLGSPPICMTPRGSYPVVVAFLSTQDGQTVKVPPVEHPTRGAQSGRLAEHRLLESKEARFRSDFVQENAFQRGNIALQCFISAEARKSNVRTKDANVQK
jgi:hypothetical protein